MKRPQASLFLETCALILENNGELLKSRNNKNPKKLCFLPWPAAQLLGGSSLNPKAAGLGPVGPTWGCGAIPLGCGQRQLLHVSLACRCFSRCKINAHPRVTVKTKQQPYPPAGAPSLRGGPEGERAPAVQGGPRGGRRKGCRPWAWGTRTSSPRPDPGHRAHGSGAHALWSFNVRTSSLKLPRPHFGKIWGLKSSCFSLSSFWRSSENRSPHWTFPRLLPTISFLSLYAKRWSSQTGTRSPEHTASQSSCCLQQSDENHH